jgi:hypothetical protein
MCRKAMRTHFLHPWHRIKRHGRSRLSDVLSRRMALTTHNLPSRRLKKRLLWSRWGDVSRCRKTNRTFFLHPGHRKKRRGRSCLSNVLTSEWPWEFIICLLDVKKRHWWKRWSDVSRCRRTIQTHILHNGHRKKRLGQSRLSDDLSRRMAQRIL